MVCPHNITTIITGLRRSCSEKNTKTAHADDASSPFSSLAQTAHTYAHYQRKHTDNHGLLKDMCGTLSTLYIYDTTLTAFTLFTVQMKTSMCILESALKEGKCVKQIHALSNAPVNPLFNDQSESTKGFFDFFVIFLSRFNLICGLLQMITTLYNYWLVPLVFFHYKQ